MGKCDFCADLLAKGENPACVDACLMRTLQYGEIDELRKQHGDLADLKMLPDSGTTKPSLVLTPTKEAKK